MQQTQTHLSSALSGLPSAERRTLVHGPLSKSTWADARTLMIVAALTFLVKSDQAASVFNWISGPSGFKPKMVPVLFSTILLYFLLVFLAHAVSDLITWWPVWREMQVPNGKSSRLLTAFVAIRFVLEGGVPLVFAILVLL
jgi:hypothetical protein